MATSWILGKVSDAIQPTIQGACASAGSFAGGAMNYVGSSINGVGESINTNIRAYGDGAKDYGNSIMDWTAAPGLRAQTAGNPLGLSSTTGGGKSNATNPSIYRASAGSKRETMPAINARPPQKKTTSTSTVVKPTSSVPVGKVKTKPVTRVVDPVKKPSSLTASGTPTRSVHPPTTSSVSRSKPVAGKVASTVTKPKNTVTSSTSAGATKAKQSSGQNLAKNPLGLSF